MLLNQSLLRMKFQRCGSYLSLASEGFSGLLLSRTKQVWNLRKLAEGEVNSVEFRSKL